MKSYKAEAIKLDHPLGEFYLTSIPARILLEVMQIDRFKAYVEKGDRAVYSVGGVQRKELKSRKKLISEFVKSDEAVFPSSIIIAANDFSESSGEGEGDTESFDIDDSIGEISKKWTVEKYDCNGQEHYKIDIPLDSRGAFVIDGQHRLYGFWQLKRDYEQGALYEELQLSKDRLDTPLPCSVFFKIPKVFQAYIFATVNFNQKPVDKSLAYELFAFNLEGEPETWSPDKLAVFISRKLNSIQDEDIINFRSRTDIPLRSDVFLRRIKVSGQSFEDQREDGTYGQKISMSTMINGILPLISKNPQMDRAALYRFEQERPRSILIDDKSILRKLYINYYDQDIYSIISRFFSVFEYYLLRRQAKHSFYHKTVGVMAGFALLRRLLERDFETRKDISIQYFLNELKGLESIPEYAGELLGEASGAGKNKLTNLLLVATGIAKSNENLIGRGRSIEEYREILLHTKEEEEEED